MNESLLPSTPVRFFVIALMMLACSIGFMIGEFKGYNEGRKVKPSAPLFCEDWSKPETCKWESGEPLPKQFQRKKE